MGNRHSLGFAAAALFTAAGAAVEQGWSYMSWALSGFGILILIVAFADRLPYLHRLPPPWGAVKPPTVEWHVEGRTDLRFEMEAAPQNVILALGLSHPNQRKIREVDLNASVVGSGSIRRCSQSGEPWEGGGKMLRADGPYWMETDAQIGRKQVMWFEVEIPEPGRYPIVLVLDSPEFYEADDVPYEHTLEAVGVHRATDAYVS